MPHGQETQINRDVCCPDLNNTRRADKGRRVAANSSFCLGERKDEKKKSCGAFGLHPSRLTLIWMRSHGTQPSTQRLNGGGGGGGVGEGSSSAHSPRNIISDLHKNRLRQARDPLARSAAVQRCHGAPGTSRSGSNPQRAVSPASSTGARLRLSV